MWTGVRPGVVAGVLALGLTSCSANLEGPLEGSRTAAGDVTVCAPASAGPRVVFGEVLANSGSSAATIDDVISTAQHATAVELRIDLAGPGLDQVIGTSALPPSHPVGHEEEVFARSVPAVNAVVPAGTSASLLVVVTPDGGPDISTVDEIDVAYTADGHAYREQILVRHVVAPGETC